MNWVSPFKKRKRNADILSNNKIKGKRTLNVGLLFMFLLAADIKHLKATMLSYYMLWKIKAKFLNILYFTVYPLFFPSLLSWITFSVSRSRMLEEKEEPGFLTGLKIPAPWAAGKTVETVHPVRDNYKFKETVHIPGARCLYLRFDSRCSSQYDYDKVSKHWFSVPSALTSWFLRCFLFFFAAGHHSWLIPACRYLLGEVPWGNALKGSDWGVRGVGNFLRADFRKLSKI